MTHADDDGLVLPPRLAPKQIVILPIYRNDQDQSKVLEHCQALRQALSAIHYNDRRLEVLIDDRDVAGGQKKWQHIKRGVPIRLEIGVRDMDQDKVFVGRRDQDKAVPMDRSEFMGSVTNILDEMQQGLFDRAERLRNDHTQSIDSLDEFKAFFTPQNSKKPEIHGGFAVCHFVDESANDAILKPLKVTPRCIPLDQQEEPGTCIFTGKPTSQKAIFSKAY